MKEVPMYPPIPEQLRFRLKSSMYKLKSIGEIIPPCLTPFVTQNWWDMYYPSVQTFSDVSTKKLTI